MSIRIPLEKLNNAFDKQFMAMRYLLLGLMEKNPEYKLALEALESASPYRADYLKTKRVEPDYLDKLLFAFDLYDRLEGNANGPRQMAMFLTPNFEDFPVAKSGKVDLDDGDILETEPADVPALGKATSKFEKLFISMQYFLLGLIVHEKSYKVSYEAMLFAAGIHVGVRKDGFTPEFQHQLEIAHLIRTMLRGLMFPAETLAAIFLHDTPEDYDVLRAELERRFGTMVADAAMLLNKYDEQGNAKPLDEYYPALGLNPITSIAKPGDNGQNQSTMAGVFTYKKQFEYSLNIRKRSWDMIKVARRLFPEQEAVYENLKFLLRIQYNAVHAMLAAVEFDPVTGKIHPALQA